MSARLLLQRIARLRVALGFGCGVVVFWLARPTRVTLASGVVVVLVGESLRIWAAGHLNKSREVTRSGPYRWSAHPLYVGSSIIGAGVAIASGRISVVVIVVAYLALTLTAAIKSEEAFLRQTFGDEYDAYRLTRGSYRLSRGSSRQSDGSSDVTRRVDTDRRFSMSRAVANREHRAVAGIVAAFLLLVWKATYNGSFWRPAGR